MKDIKEVNRTFSPVSKWLTTAKVEYTVDGKTHFWDYVTRKQNNPEKIDAVVIAATIDKNEDETVVPLIREYRPAFGRHIISFPAGLIENQSDIQEDIKRECKEELGFDVKEIKFISDRLCTSAGLTDETYVYSIVTLEWNETAVQALEEKEDIEVILADRKKLIELIEDKSNLWCGRTYPFVKVVINMMFKYDKATDK